MKNKFFTTVAVLLAFLLTAGTLFAGGQTETEAPDVIKIGASISLSGNLARFGNMVKSGYELWAEQVNAQGGIDVGGKKMPVEIVYYDDQSDNQTAVKLTEKLITEDKVQFLLGPFGSGPTFATTAIAEKYNIITIATLANATNIYDRGFQNVFAVLLRRPVSSPASSTCLPPRAPSLPRWQSSIRMTTSPPP